MGDALSTKLLLSTSRTGPFISGTSHSILSLGQRPIIGGLSDDEDEDDPYSPGGMKESAANSSGQKGRGGSGRGGRGRGGGSAAKRARGGVLTLQDLIDGGIIFPGRHKISVHYKGTVYTASLGKDGMILYQGKKFQSATSFSIHCKRMQTPNKQGDDGWKSVLYEDQPLEMYRKRYVARQPPPVQQRPATRRPAASSEDAADEEMAETDDAAAAAAAAAEGGGGGASAAADAAEAAAAAEATDQWVQCDRCRTWRIVPDQHWPSVEADTREVWYCEYADWTLTAVAPFKESCAV